MNKSTTRRAFLFAIGMALGKLDVLKASNGLLTVDLSQWQAVVFKLGKQTVSVPVADIFAAIREGA